ncbi:hypothetical protein CYY_007503, partial [Polysphondylium violaceum]
LYLNSNSTATPNALIRYLKTSNSITPPDSVKVYKSSHPPLSYTPSLEKLYILSKSLSALSFPTTLRQVYFVLNKRNVSYLSGGNESLYLKNRYQNICLPCSSNNNIDLFFKIWRNPYLYIRIYEMNLSTKINFIKEGDRVYKFENQDRDHCIHQSLKFRDSGGLSVVPDGVTYYSVGYESDRQNSQSLLALLPSSVTKLKIDCKGLGKDVIPSSIKHLVLPSSSSIYAGSIPSTVKILEIKCSQNSMPFTQFAASIPTTVEKVILGTKCLLGSRFLKKEMLAYLTERKLVDEVYQVVEQTGEPVLPNTTVLLWKPNEMIPVGVVPYGVKRIVFGFWFNQTIAPESVPASVTEINFGDCFDQCLSLVHLPLSLKYLSLCHYNHPLKPFSLPPNLVRFQIIGKPYSHTQTLVHLPRSVRYIKIHKHKLKQDYVNDSSLFKATHFYSHCTEDQQKLINDINQGIQQHQQQTTSNSLSPSLEVHLYISENFAITPGLLNHLNIQSISFGGEFNQSLLPDSLPDTVKKLGFDKGSLFNQEMLAIPPGIQDLDLTHYSCETHLTSALPPSLTRLKMCKNYQPLSSGFFPQGLKSLIFDHSVNLCTPDTIPDTVTQLSLRRINKQSLSFIPPTVHTLSLGMSDQEILKSIPKTVKELVLYPYSNMLYFDSKYIPATITKLSVFHQFHINLLNIDKLPPSVKSLSCTDSKPSVCKIPSTVEHIELTNYCPYY